ncbi:hypothetical protein INT48_007269 [Thamnidium elegans]|uniref:Uncharacterized protein n=1 Tax=Thamnidium elegans TaxID=101142 RepID=A0A8H7SLN7_9FUNG|nr:hypothetical protein INT48_007269 [Thamnidium elegans]
MAIPNSNKLSSNYIINQSFAESFNIHKCLCDMYASELSDMVKVIDAYLKRHEGESDADKAHRIIVKSFSVLSKNSQYQALAEYAASLTSYYHEDKVRFIELYQQRLQRPSRPRPLRVVRRLSRLKRPRTASESSSTSLSSIAIREATEQGNDLDLAFYEFFFFFFFFCSTGLSSVVDFVDNNEDSQRQVFEDSRWKHLSKLVQEFHKSEQYHLPKFLKDTWKLVSVFCERTGSTKKAQEYLKEIINPKTSINKKPETLKIISIFLFVLEIFEDCKWLFDPDRNKSGNDFFSILWGPIIRKMLSIHNNIMDLK